MRRDIECELPSLFAGSVLISEPSILDHDGEGTADRRDECSGREHDRTGQAWGFIFIVHHTMTVPELGRSQPLPPVGARGLAMAIAAGGPLTLVDVCRMRAGVALGYSDETVTGRRYVLRCVE